MCSRSGGGGNGIVDIGGGYKARQSTIDQRQKLNEMILGHEVSKADAEYSVRRDMQSGMSEKQVIADTERRFKIQEQRRMSTVQERKEREITSSTYKRAMRRTTKKVADYLGRGLT